MLKKPWVVISASLLAVVVALWMMRAVFAARNRSQTTITRDGALDAQCKAAGKHPYGWRYAHEKASVGEALAGQDGCSPLSHYGESLGRFCCPPR